MASGVLARKDHRSLNSRICSDAKVSESFQTLEDESTSSFSIRFFLPFPWWELPFIVGWCSRSDLFHPIGSC